MSGAPPNREDIHEIFQLCTAVPNRLTHLHIDDLAAKVPDHVLFSYPKTADIREGFRDVSSKDFANAIHRASWFLLQLLGKPKNFESVCYMGPNDIRYFILMFAAIRVGYKMLFLSPRNHLEGHLNVLAGVDCDIMLRAKETNVDEILGKRQMQTSTIPELEDLLDNKTSVEFYPYTKTFEEAKMDPCLVLHTTGSTGLPKPITWKLGILSTYEAWRTIPHVNDYVPTTEIYQQSRRAYTSMPLFHTSGLNAGITWSLLLGVTLVYGGPRTLANASYTDQMHMYAGVDASMGAPSIYEDLSRDPDSLKRMKNMHYVVASGAPLSQTAGKLISQHTRIISNLGATETACLQRLSPSVQDWDYYYWHPTHSGIEMREYMDGLYELFIVRKPNLGLFQGVFYTFPQITEWSMNDLYERHPDPAKPFLYRYRGRKDDVIVLSNGEKISPALMETALMADPRVRGAMVVGRGKFQPAVLIDLKDSQPKTAEERQQLVRTLLPCIAKANEHAPGHGKLDQYHILFADPKKPIHYLGQGKIQRHITYRRYEQEIEQLYLSADAVGGQSGLSNMPRLDARSKESILHWLKKLVYEIADGKELQVDQDMFVAGIDSLQVIRMTHELNIQAQENVSAKEGKNVNFLPERFYQNPSLTQLATFIFNQINGTHSVNGSGKSHGNSNGDASAKASSARDLQAILDKFTATLPRSSEGGPTKSLPTENMVVVLTGSTGSLGSYLLDVLYHDEKVSRVVCLNRKPDAKKYQSRLGKDRGLNTDFDPARVEFLQADLSRPFFGLNSESYEQLLGSVTHVIHNQWPVNFNWTVSSFEPFIEGVRNLINFSHDSKHGSFLQFISSVSSVGNWNRSGAPPEKPVHDLSVASMGYGQSKLIAECLLDEASRVSGVPSACCRVGIVAGPVERSSGMWNRHEYIPSIIISAAHLGHLPDSFSSRDRIDWIPVDKLSKILVNIVKLSSSPTTAARDKKQDNCTQIFHVVNPQVISWKTLVPWVLDNYPRDANVKPVPFQEWVKSLEKAAAVRSNEPEEGSATALLSFYQNAQDADKARELISSRDGAYDEMMQQIGPVSPDWVATWMRQWGF